MNVDRDSDVASWKTRVSDIIVPGLASNLFGPIFPKCPNIFRFY